MTNNKNCIVLYCIVLLEEFLHCIFPFLLMLLHGTSELPMWNFLCNFPILEDDGKRCSSLFLFGGRIVLTLLLFFFRTLRIELSTSNAVSLSSPCKHFVLMSMCSEWCEASFILFDV